MTAYGNQKEPFMDRHLARMSWQRIVVLCIFLPPFAFLLGLIGAASCRTEKAKSRAADLILLGSFICGLISIALFR